MKTKVHIGGVVYDLSDPEERKLAHATPQVRRRLMENKRKRKIKAAQRKAAAEKAARDAEELRREEELIAKAEAARARREKRRLILEGLRVEEQEDARLLAEAAAVQERRERDAWRTELASLGDSPEDRARASRMMGERLASMGLDPHAIGYSPSAHVRESERYRDPLPRDSATDPKLRARQDARLRAAGLTPAGVVLPSGGGRKTF